MNLLVPLRAAAVAHAAVVCTQPVLAGIYLDGSGGAGSLHEPLGLAAAALGAAQTTLAVLWWRASGRLWPLLVSAVILAAEILLIHAGYGRDLTEHLPLGVGVVGLSVALAGGLVRQQPAAVRR